MKLATTRHLVFHLVGFLDMFAASLVAPSFPVHIKSFGASSTLTGAILSIYGAIQLFSSPLIGKWSDKNGRLNVLAICLLITSSGYMLSGFYISSLVAMSLLRILPGIFKHTQDLCRCCLIEESGKNKTQALGTFNAFSSMGFIIGPTIHGHLMEYFGRDSGLFVSYAICASIFVLNFAIVCLLRLYTSTTTFETENCEPSVAKNKNGLAQVKDHSQNDKLDQGVSKFQRGVFVSRFLLSLAVMMFRSSFVLWLTHYHPDLPSTTTGYLLSYNGFLGLLFGFLVGTVSNLKFYRGNEEKLQFHASCLVIFSFIVFLISSRIEVILFAMTTLSMGTAILRVCGPVLTAKYLKGHNIGQVQGLGSSVLSVARFGAPLVSGILQEASFSAPNMFSLVLSFTAVGVFYNDSYLFAHDKLKQE